VQGPSKHAGLRKGRPAAPCAFPDAPLCLLGLAAQRAHDDPEVLRVDGTRPVLVEQVERVLDLVELVLVELLLSSVELALCSLLGLRTRADRQQLGLRAGVGSRAPGFSCCCPACSPCCLSCLRATSTRETRKLSWCGRQAAPSVTPFCIFAPPSSRVREMREGGRERGLARSLSLSLSFSLLILLLGWHPTVSTR
jgi:hypothetical protein